ncbi:MAG: aspartate/glutamate racemase family protein [Anaerolineae bacterium]|nr:aspartate/glutamate racemase family protein [Anaerolineae bacterium]
MKTIGLLGGMSWESSLEYYRFVNEAVKERLGGLHSAQCLMFSFDFAQIEALQMAGDWDMAAHLLAEAAQNLERGGAECIVLCTNTMHKLARSIEEAVNIPLLHISDPTGEAIRAAGIDTIGLLGTRFTMEHDFYKGRLVEKFGLNVLTPDDAGRTIVHDIIYQELVLGEVREESRLAYQGVMADLVSRGAQGIILGCTEIELLIKPEHSPVPTFDTTYLHAVAAVDWALQETEK